MHVTSISFLKRWRRGAYQISKDIIITSNEFRGRHTNFGVKYYFVLLSLGLYAMFFEFLNFFLCFYVF